MNAETTALTHFTTLKQKVEQLLALERITEKDIEDLSNPDRRFLAETCTAIVQPLKGEERDNFLDKISGIIPASTKAEIWEYNHSVISDAISKYMRERGVMPAKSDVAKQTGLSRQTVAKHFAAYNRHPEFNAQMEQFKFMAPNLLASVYKYALNGDMRAARLYLEMVDAVKQQSGMVVNEQNNYIQINNTILSQQNLKQLTNDQLNQIERIIINKEKVMA